MVDVTHVPATGYYDAGRGVALFTSVILLISSFYLWSGFWAGVALVALFFSLSSIVIELLNDGDGIRSHISPVSKAFFYAAATFCLLPFFLIPPFLVPLGYLVASCLYFTDYRHRARRGIM